MKSFKIISLLLVFCLQVQSMANNREMSCYSLNSETLQADGFTTLKFEINSKQELLKVTHADSNGRFVDGIQNKKFGIPQHGHENEPLVLLPRQSSQIKDGNAYIGKFCRNSLFDQYYNRWIFIDRDFLNNQKTSAYIVMYVSQSVSGTLGKLHDYVFLCQ